MYRRTFWQEGVEVSGVGWVMKGMILCWGGDALGSNVTNFRWRGEGRRRERRGIQGGTYTGIVTLVRCLEAVDGVGDGAVVGFWVALAVALFFKALSVLMGGGNIDWNEGEIPSRIWRKLCSGEWKLVM